MGNSIAKHNNLIKVLCGNGNHFRHVMSNEKVHEMTEIEKRYPVSQLPVCSHCEGLAFWYKDNTGYCIKCGTYTKDPMRFSEYLIQGHDLSDTMDKTEKKMIKESREIVLG